MTTNPPKNLHALATDYDGTLAHHGAVSESTLAAIARLKAAGLRLILVTGRELHELKSVFPEITLCDLAVVENGAVLYHPETGLVEPLAPSPPNEFIARLHDLGLPLQIGISIVATWEPHEEAVFQTIREMGLDLQVILNKGAVMILPSGVDKASGLRAALAQLGIEPAQVAGVGDAENDLALLEACGFSVAVGNALPALKEKADCVTRRPHGDGVADLIDALVRESQR